MEVSKWSLLQAFLVLILVGLGNSQSPAEKWARFKLKYKNNYGTTTQEEKHRYTFFKSLEFIDRRNRLYVHNHSSYWTGWNEYTDIDLSDPYKYASSPPELPEATDVPLPLQRGHLRYEQLPANGINWVRHGIISEIGNQRSTCLGCWAFSTTSLLEAHIAKYYGVILNLSPQHLIDCVPKPFPPILNRTAASSLDTTLGCLGGHGTCRSRSSVDIRQYVRNYTTLKDKNETRLAEVVYNFGPVAASIDYLHDAFQHYAGGILSIPECQSNHRSLRHSVLIVGFGTDRRWGDYWLIKNSYETTWGDNGYFRLARNAGNMCGVATLPQLPIVREYRQQ